MAIWRGPTLRSLVEVLERVIGRGVVVESDVPVSPALAQLRGQATVSDEATGPLSDAGAPPGLTREPAAGAAREGLRAPARGGDRPD